VNPSKHIVRANGRDVNLTYKEFELLSLLIQNDGAVFTRDQILQKVWGFEFDGENRTVDVHIRTLRPNWVIAAASLRPSGESGIKSEGRHDKENI
jgi:two-component system alkaline phosphatase synthesis response regulator PhoP